MDDLLAAMIDAATRQDHDALDMLREMARERPASREEGMGNSAKATARVEAARKAFIAGRIKK